MVALPGLWPTAASPTLPLSPLGRDPGSGTRRLQLGSLVYGRQSLPELMNRLQREFYVKMG